MKSKSVIEEYITQRYCQPITGSDPDRELCPDEEGLHKPLTNFERVVRGLPVFPFESKEE